MKPNFMLHHHGIWEKMESMFKWFRSFVVIHYFQPPGAGAFSRDFTTFTPQCKAFSRALEIEKLKALLFRGPEGAGNMFCLIWFLRPINNLSVIKGRVFLGWTSTKLGLMFLLKDTTQWRRWGSNPRPFGLESSTLPLCHCARGGEYKWLVHYR